MYMLLVMLLNGQNLNKNLAFAQRYLPVYTLEDI